MEVVIAAEAQIEIARINLWWRANRLYAQTLFYDELQSCIRTFEANPRSGKCMRRRPEIRRVLLRRSRYYVFARLHRDLVEIVWVRGAMRMPLRF